MSVLIFRDLMVARDVAITCLLLSKSVPNHTPFVNEASAHMMSSMGFEVYGFAELCDAHHGLLHAASLI